MSTAVLPARPASQLIEQRTNQSRCGQIRLSLKKAAKAGRTKLFLHSIPGFNDAISIEKAAITRTKWKFESRIFSSFEQAEHKAVGLDLQIGRASCRERV